MDAQLRQEIKELMLNTLHEYFEADSLSDSTASKIIGVTPRTLYNWRKAGLIKGTIKKSQLSELRKKVKA